MDYGRYDIAGCCGVQQKWVLVTLLVGGGAGPGLSAGLTGGLRGLAFGWVQTAIAIGVKSLHFLRKRSGDGRAFFLGSWWFRGP